MKEGDLCYIPQAVKLYNKKIPYVETTTKPIAGIYLEASDEQWALIFENGRKLLAPKKHVYPMEETC